MIFSFQYFVNRLHEISIDFRCFEIWNLDFDFGLGVLDLEFGIGSWNFGFGVILLKLT